NECRNADIGAIGKFPFTLESRWRHNIDRRHNCSYLQSGSLGCLRSHNGLLLRTTGSFSKLYSGGGELVVHSSVQASQGSSPARFPHLSELITFQTKINIPAT